MKHIGFTGTRHGMTARQLHYVSWAIEDSLDDADLVSPPAFWAHHGDCVGADREFHDLVRERFACVGALVHVHPGPDGEHRANCDGDIVSPVLPHMRRNRVIVELCPVMIAAPYEDVEQDRGGTWATIRMARRAKRKLYVVARDGRLLTP